MLLKSIKYLFCITLLLQLNSCSLGFLINKNQKVTVVKDSLVTVKINKKDPEIKNCKYILPRNGEPQQVILTREGYKTQYIVLTPHKFSNEGIGTVAINAAFIGIPFTTFTSLISPTGFLAFGLVSSSLGAYYGYLVTCFNPKFWRYDKVINLNDKMINIPVRDSVSQEIKLNKVAIDLTPEKSKEYILKYNDYKKGKLIKSTNIKAENGIKLDDTNFTEELNTLLEKNNFIDTTGFVLNSNYNQNAYLNATIIGYKYLWIPNSGRAIDDRKTGFINIELDIKWDVLDFYKKTIYSDTIKSKSGEFVSYVSNANSNYYRAAIMDAMETSMYTLMNKEKFRNITRLTKSGIIDTLQSLEIKNPKDFVSTIEQAVQSSVTIKTSKGHASGFFISKNGYLITNYHVISDTSKLEIILNDGSKFIPKIVRFNKESDIALLKIEKDNIVPFKLTDIEQAGIGKEIYVIGTPSAEDLSQTLTKGIISSVRKQANGSKIIQTDASISRGNSGGPLIDKEGRLLGIINTKLIGFGIEGISFAIPANEIVKYLGITLK
jgi:hypothetical protein